MIHSGNAITVQMLSDGIAELRFDLQGESVNKFNRATVEDLKAATDAIKAHSDITGVVVTSGKPVFIVGADITEFGDNFAQGEAAIADWLGPVNAVFSGFEDLPVPTVAAINGIALGGGFEIAKVEFTQIKMEDIVRAIDGDDLFNRCSLGLHECSDDQPCPFHHKYKPIRENLKKTLRETSLADLILKFNSGDTYLKL